eukprot:15474052-Alexandrium_andersonii.AAC.1
MQEALAQEQSHLGGDAHTLEVGNVDREAELAAQRPEVLGHAPHARARKDVLHRPGLGAEPRPCRRRTA